MHHMKSFTQLYCKETLKFSSLLWQVDCSSSLIIWLVVDLNSYYITFNHDDLDFVGNICRSPTAEAVFKAVVEQNKLSDRYDIDSCGTGGGVRNW